MAERLLVFGAGEDQAIIEDREFGEGRFRAARQVEETVDHGCELRARLQTRKMVTHTTRRLFRWNADHHTGVIGFRMVK
jgi:hypothetical protein